MALLEVKGLTKYFGGLVALNDVDFHVEKGEILGLIGPNGAGKTTLYNVVSSLYPPTRGTVVFNGEDLTRLPMRRIAQKGLVRTFQLTELFREMTTYENIVIAHHIHSKEGVREGIFNTRRAREDRKEIANSTDEILRFVGLDKARDVLAKNLPHGYQRALGIAIGLAVNPTLLMLDEPVTGMNPAEIMTFMGTLRRIRDERGITLMLVEHNMKAVMSICDRIFVLNFGKKIAEGSPSEISQNGDVIEAYLGVEEAA